MSLLEGGLFAIEEKSRDNEGFQEDEAGGSSSDLAPTHKQASGDSLGGDNFVVLWKDLVYSIDRPTHISHSNLDRLRSKFASVVSMLAQLSLHSSGRYEVNKKELSGNSDCSKCILKRLNGAFKSGQLTAIMGPSGAGKTSLLNILSRRLKVGFSGQLVVESENQKEKKRIRINAIPQHDQLPPNLTVRENLMYASKLKSRRADHERNVCRASSLLGLDDCLDTRTSRISGGQQKRLSIGQELLSRPDVLVLDEPTSGLDSSTCIKTLSVLRRLVEASANGSIAPIAVLLTIHQPQWEAFNMFDRVYFLAAGGLAIYDGPPSGCAEFVRRHTRLELPTADYNPASFMVEIASGELGSEPILQLERQARICFEKERGGVSAPGECQVDQRLARGSDLADGHFLYKTGVLTKRIWHSQAREPIVLAFRIAAHLVIPISMAVMFGSEAGGQNSCPRYRAEYPLKDLIYTDKYINSRLEQDIQLTFENMALIFVALNATIHLCIGVVTIYTSLELRSSLREYHNGWYSMGSYLAARLLSNLPADLMVAPLTIGLLAGLTGQSTGSSSMPDAQRLMISSLGFALSLSVYGVMGVTLSVLYGNNIAAAIFASQAYLMPWIMLSGFAIQVKDMPEIVQKISWSSVHKHCMDIVFMTRYGWNVCSCNASELQLPGPRIGNVPDRLAKFVQYWQASQPAEDAPANSSVSGDVFEVMAQQVSAFNCFGLTIESCDQVVPFALSFTDLHKADIRHSFMALVCIFSLALVVLFVSAKALINSRSAL